MFDISNKILESKKLIQAGRLQLARALLELLPKNSSSDSEQILNLLFFIAFKERRLKDALELVNHLIIIDPHNSGNFNNQGLVFKEVGDFNSAILSFDKAIKIDPKFVDAYFNSAVTFDALSLYDRAINHYDSVIKLDKDDYLAWVNRGVALKRLGHTLEALHSYKNALSIKFEMPEVHFNCGIAYFELRDFPKSIESYQLAINFRPNYSDAYRNLGAVYSELNNHKAAYELYLKAVSIEPQFAEGYFLLGKAQQELKLLDEAIKNYSKALELNPNFPFGLGYLLHAKMLSCDWSGLDFIREKIVNGISKSKEVAEPFGFQAISDSESDLLACAKLFFANRYQHLINKSDINIKKLNIKHTNAKIRIGYVGGEFREQATTILLAGIWERHDKDKFEIYAFDNGWGDSSVWRSRVEVCFDEIIDVNNISDLDVAKMIRERHIDILINLNGYFGRSRNGVFKLRPAPLQVNFLGFPGTLGDKCMDYIVADDCVLPVSSQDFYCEKVLYMPDTYQPNDRSRKMSDRVYTRNELGLPDDGFVYCCFNNNYKITPQIFESWMRILKKVNGSVLWLLEDNPSASRNLKASAKILGVEPDRLIFANRINFTDHLARHRLADLFLDTVPYNAHTTASDALWTGLPLITIMGKTFPGRVASSLLKSLDLNELIANSFDQYEAIAVDLAINKDKYLFIKRRIMSSIESCSLFNPDVYVSKFENSLFKIHSRFLEGCTPSHLRSS